MARASTINLIEAVGIATGSLWAHKLRSVLTLIGVVIGGAVGVLIGVLMAKLVSWVSPLPSAVQLWSVIGGLAVALSVGLFFERIRHPRPPSSTPSKPSAMNKPGDSL
jgi:NAD/NADP transhydrogenase beta subunit